MFTGLVEALGSVRVVRPHGPGRELVVAAGFAAELSLGESVAVNGTCLTVVERDSEAFRFELAPETLRCTNLGELASGDRVNLERALAVGDRLGGHIAQGHIDGMGRISSRTREGEWEMMWFGCSPQLTRQMVPKGSVAVDGVSLTVVDVTPDGFSVALIPHTLQATTLGWKQPPASVNIETDLFAKYVLKYLEGLGRIPAPGCAVMRLMQSANRQTLSYLRDLFQQRGLRPKSKLGQNFLIDLNLLDVILAAGDLGADDLAVEIGAGTGSLTARLAETAGGVFSVEIDPAFYALAQEAVHGLDHVRLLRADVLKNKNHFNPEVLEQLEQVRQAWNCPRLKLVANLPYAVATPVISNFLLSGLPFERMVVTVQWEIAEKLLARPGTKEFGALSVLVQSIADVELLRMLPPSVFWPRPQVASAIICIRPNAAKRARVLDLQRLRNFLRDLYSHRRKNLRGALAGLPAARLEKSVVDQRLELLGLDGTVRAETLDVEQHLRLCDMFG